MPVDAALRDGMSAIGETLPDPAELALARSPWREPGLDPGRGNELLEVISE